MTTNNKKRLIVLSAAALLLFLAFFFTTPNHAHALTIEPLYKVLRTNDNVKSVWIQVRNFVNILVMAALIFIAFANILRIKMNDYAIKKFLPSLVGAIILTNFSYFICRFLVDISNVALGLLMNGTTSASDAAGAFVNAGSNPDVAPGVAGAFDFRKLTVDINNMGRVWIYLVGESAGTIMVLIMAFLFYIRNYVIYFLVGIAPLACMALALPQTKSLFTQWFSMLNKWIFMPIISVFWLWVGGVWYSSGFNPTKTSSVIGNTGVVPGADFNSALFGLAFAITCYYLAIQTPFKMGGSIMSGFAKLGKGAWNKTAGAGGKWLANGGVQSVMAHRNQMAAAEAKFHDKNDPRIKRYEDRANMWTRFNPRAIRQGYKARIDQQKNAWESAPTKTAAYSKMLGGGAQVAAGYAKDKDDYENMSSVQVGNAARVKIDDLKSKAKLPANSKFFSKYRDEAGKPENARSMTALGYTNVDDYAAHLLMTEIANTNDNKLSVLGDSIGIDQTAMGGYKAAFEAFSKTSKRRMERGDLISGFNTSGVPFAMPIGATGTGGHVDIGSGAEDIAEALDRKIEEKVAHHTDAAEESLGHREQIMSELATHGSDAEKRLLEIHDHASKGQEALLAGSLDAAKELALKISPQSAATLGAIDPGQLRTMLGSIFQEAGKIQKEGLAEQLHSFSTDRANWRDETKQAQLGNVQQQASLEARNEQFAETSINAESIKELSAALGSHLDGIMQANAQMSEMMANNMDGKFDKLISEARNMVTTATNSSIAKVLERQGVSGAAVSPKDIESAMKAALRDPATAKAQGKALESVIQTAGAAGDRTVANDIK